VFTVCNSSKHTESRSISLGYHLIISSDFFCTPARHLDTRILQCSGSIYLVFRLLSIALVRFASRHCSLFSQALASIIHGIIQQCLSSFSGTGPLSIANFFVTTACPSVVILIINFFFSLQCNLILKTLDQPPLSFVDKRLK